LVETPGVDRLLLADARPARVAEVAEAMGAKAEIVDWQPGTALPEGVDMVACAVPSGDDVTIARDALDAAVPFVSASDDTETIQQLLELDQAAREIGVTVVIGAGLAPGLSDVLVRHAADSFDTIDDVNIARWGAAGEASASSVRVALSDRGAELRNGEVVELKKRGGEELVWFPNPVDARPCEPVSVGLELLAHAVPGLARASIRFGRAERPARSLPLRRDPMNEWGALRVEVWGARGAGREPRVFGAIDRSATATGTVLAVTAGGLVGVLPAVLRAEPGARGLGGVVEPRAFLEELARRGLKVAIFEGVPVA
jgi:hypothetical protein